MIKKIIIIFLIALFFALFVFPQPALALGNGQTTPATISTALKMLEAALLGVATWLITDGLKDKFPQLTPVLIQFAAALIAFILNWASGFLLPLEGTIWAPLLIDAIYVAVTWLTSLGTNRFEKQFRLALAGAAG